MTLPRHFLSALIAIIVLATPLSSIAAAPDSFAPIVEPLMPAVVNISTTQKVPPQMQGLDPDATPDAIQNEQLRQFFKQYGGMNPNLQGAHPDHPVTSLGSGFVIDAQGYIVTNNHVVGNADQITVTFQDNSHLTATIVGRDEKTDLALLKVTPSKPLTAVHFGDSEAMHVGDWVIAVGDPFGLGGSVSAGIVSARGRNINAGPFDDFIQTDAAINRGNSGGPLFNTRGEVIGINAAIFSPSGGNIGIGFAVPSAMAKNVVEQLRQYGTLHRGWLGVKIELVSDEMANSLGLQKTRGALLRDTTKPGPADSAGLVPGDVILKFDGHDIDEMRKLPRLVAESKSGKKIDVIYWRKGHEQTAHVTIGEVPKDTTKTTEPDQDQPGAKLFGSKKGADNSNLVLGLKLTPTNKQARDQFQLKPDVAGLFVEAIDLDGEAAKRGITPGDVILEANQTNVNSIDELRNAIAAAKKTGRDYLLIRILRHNEPIFITVSIK